MTDCCQNATNPVHCVQGVQGRKLPTMHRCKPRKAWLCAFLCRVCRVDLRGRVRDACKTTLPIKVCTSRAYMYPAHPAHPAQAASLVGCVCAGYIYALRTPCTLYFFIKKIMKKIICGKENVESFRAELKAALPDFYTLAKQLYTSGLITGLRGATLEIGDFSEQPYHTVTEEAENAATCEICGNWQRDTVGDGTGIGQCLLNEQPTRLKYPGMTACKQFEAQTWR